MALARIAMPSPNYSSRGGSRVTTIVLHTAQGATTIESLGNFFASPSSGVSSHAGADDKPNTIGVYVERSWKAWTQANANPYSVSIELCAFAEWDTAEWDRHPNMLANCAAWIAEEAAAFGIPIRKLSAYDAQHGAAGVCQHADLGAAGGGHWDCGEGFPIDRVLDMALSGGAPKPPQPEEDDDMASIRIMSFVGEEPAIWMVDLGQMTKVKVPDPATVDFLHNLGVTDVTGPQPMGYAFVDITDYRQPASSGTRAVDAPDPD